MFTIEADGSGPRDSIYGIPIQNLETVFRILADETPMAKEISTQEFTDFLERLKKSAIEGLRFTLIDGMYFTLLIQAPRSFHRVKFSLQSGDVTLGFLHLDEIEVYKCFREKTLMYLSSYPELQKLTIHDCSVSLLSPPQKTHLKRTELLESCLRGVWHIEFEGSLAHLGDVEKVLPRLSNLRVFSLAVSQRQTEFNTLKVFLPVLLARIPSNLEELTIPWIELESLARCVYEACERVVSLKVLTIKRFANHNPPEDSECYLTNIVRNFGVTISGFNGLFYRECLFSGSTQLRVILTLLSHLTSGESAKLCVDVRAILVKMIFGECPRAVYQGNLFA